MARGRCTFRQRDLTAALKAARAAGLSIAGVKIDNAGTIEIISGAPQDPPPSSAGNEWDDVLCQGSP